MTNGIFLLKLLILACLLGLAYSSLTFFNLECKSIDKNFADFEYCRIKAVNRTLKTGSLKVNLFKVPVYNVSWRFAMSYRANGWKPFLYNITIDACKFLKSRNKHPVVEHAYKTFVDYSNLNHTCPYNHDLIVNDVPSNFVEKMWSVSLPLPLGDYRFSTTWYAYNIPRADVIVYIRIA